MIYGKQIQHFCDIFVYPTPSECNIYETRHDHRKVNIPRTEPETAADRLKWLKYRSRIPGLSDRLVNETTINIRTANIHDQQHEPRR